MTTSGAATATPTAKAQPVPAKPSNVWADDKADYFALSLRDKRVLTNCLQENLSSLPQGILIAGPTSTGLEKGQTLPASLGTKVRSLPLACERELPALPNNMERVLYGGRVLLLDESAKILDVFAVAK